LLIDAILNNFARYKRRPLYVDLDHLLGDTDTIDRLLACGGYVVKTHFPHDGKSTSHAEQIQRLIPRAVIISPVRDREAVLRSSLAFGTAHSRSDFSARAAAFADVWGGHEIHHVHFTRLVDRDHYAALVADLSNWLGIPPNAKLVLPLPKRARAGVYFAKLSTRVLGRASPIINTTIGLYTTRHGARAGA
jgi:hypothetical protein